MLLYLFASKNKEQQEKHFVSLVVLYFYSALNIENDLTNNFIY